MSKRLYLGGVSALEAWTAVSLGLLPRPRRTRMTAVRGCAVSDEDIRAFDLGRTGVSTCRRPVDVLVSSESPNSETRFARRRRMPREFPQGTFFEIAPDEFIAHPGFCVMQAASLATIPETAVFCTELAGYYALDKTAQKGFVKRAPIVAAKDLVEYLSLWKRARNARTALRAAKLSTDGSRSPMESKLFVLLSAQGTLGCLGYPRPVLNKRLAVNGENRYCDMLWEDRRVAVEYDSDGFHTGSENIDRDARRRNTLCSNGIAVMTATARQVLDKTSMLAFAFELARLLHVRKTPRVSDFDGRFARTHGRIMLADDPIPRPSIPSRRIPFW